MPERFGSLRNTTSGEGSGNLELTGSVPGRFAVRLNFRRLVLPGSAPAIAGGERSDDFDESDFRDSDRLIGGTLARGPLDAKKSLDLEVRGV